LIYQVILFDKYDSLYQKLGNKLEDKLSRFFRITGNCGAVKMSATGMTRSGNTI